MNRTIPIGLNEQEVEQSRKIHGENALTPKKRNSFWKQFLESFGDPIIKILLVALALNVLFLFRNANWFESIGIAVAVFLATFVSTLSEYGSESAFLKLQEEAARMQCRVKRANRLFHLPITEIVVGDFILLQAGEKVPADGILISGKLAIDQSALNGESKEVTKIPDRDTFTTRDLTAKNQIFRGSIVTAGEGIFLVKSVGDATFYGTMAQEMQEESRESPLKVKLNGLAQAISRIGYVAAILVTIADMANVLFFDQGIAHLTVSSFFQCFLHAITLGITVVVVAVPEGLPMMITVVLSSNMFRMLKDNVMVRKLVGIETSGSMNLLFTDKTGTLTKGKLQVTTFISGDKKEYSSPAAIKAPLWELIELSSTYNTGSVLSKGQILGGNATDRALLEYVAPLKKASDAYSKVDTVPFDSVYKFSAVHICGKQEYFFVKGAPEKLFPVCNRFFDENGVIQPIGIKTQLQQKWTDLTKKAMRVLVLAVSETPVTAEGRFQNLILLGFVGIRDELRPEARMALRTIQKAGIQVVMITGDNQETATAIAKEAGLVKEITPFTVFTSDQLSKMSDDEVKKALVQICVVARALPSDKSRLVRIAQESGFVVGMTGDGINDAPALKKADVGFAMGTGTEVAKEAGDIVILDNNIASIGKAILYGRTIFHSIRKFIVFQLTMNLCAVGVSLLCPFIGIDTPVTVIQMLWINIIMDTLAGLAFAGEAPLREYMQEVPKRREEPVLTSYMVTQILCMGIYTITLCVLFLKMERVQNLFRYSDTNLYFMTAFFALFIFTGVFNCLNARTHRLNLFAHLGENPFFIIIMLGVIGVQLLLIYYGGTLFRTAGLTPSELNIILLLSFTVIPMDLLRKVLLRLFRLPSSNEHTVP